MARRPDGVPHRLSWVRRVDDVAWVDGEPPDWGWERVDDLEDRELALELGRCAVASNASLATAARKLGVALPRATRAMHVLRNEAAPRRGPGVGPLSDSAIYKRLRRERASEGRMCLAPGCDNPISPRKRLGTYACSGRCRKRIFDAGGRERILENARIQEREQRLAEEQKEREEKLPPASPLVSRCARCSSVFTGPSAIDEFKAHTCSGHSSATA
ncbi:MAG: hypothetical protein M3P18_21760 [Actinomycetota bacterium]|nr:hypothetical protein [Actinomycetota bacterium]